MKMPEAVQIGPHSYKVKVTKRLPEDLAGRTSNTRAKIEMLSKQAHSNKQDTLIHESLHAILFQSGALTTLKFEGNTEEQLVVTISPWILQWIQDNPELIAYLTSAE